MKQLIYRYTLLLMAFSLVAGCKKDFLQLAPISNPNVDIFYKTPADIRNAVTAAYKIHKQIYTTDFMSQNILDELRSDNAGSGFGDPVDAFTKDTGKEWYGWSWDKCYRAIYMSNLVLEKAEAVDMDATVRNQYYAQCRFLRAITYLELVRNFGGVPLVTETPKSLDANVIQIPRNTPAEVYNQIIEDLLFAEANLPAQWEASDIGRATKGAAQGMLGKVYLTTGDKASAEAILRKVISSGLYQLLPTYAAVWDINSRNSAESLFELQFRTVTDPSPMMNYFNTPAVPSIPGGGVGYNPASQDLVNAFEPGDSRKAGTLGVDPNGVWYTVKYNDPTMTAGFQSSHNFPILRYADVLLLLAEALGEGTEAYNLINQIRNRAGLGDIGPATPGSFIYKLAHERQVELAYENHRWHDLLRLGIAIPVMNAHLAQNGTTIGQDDLLMPIPNTAILSNPKLQQNPGY